MDERNDRSYYEDTFHDGPYYEDEGWDEDEDEDELGDDCPHCLGTDCIVYVGENDHGVDMYCCLYCGNEWLIFP